MPIKHLHLQNIGPFAGERHFDLPAVCLIQGGNGVGKTGLQDAIKYVGDRGHDPDMIHGNAEYGEITITMADEYQMRARITRGETQRAWKPPEGKRWIVNRAYIDEICTALAYDPLRFLDKEPTEQAQDLLRLAPLPPCGEEITSAVGSLANGTDVNGSNPLEIIDSIYNRLYEERKQLNTAAGSLEKHADELGRTLVEVPQEGYAAKLTAKRAEKGAIEAQQRSDVEAINKNFQTDKQTHEQGRANAYLKADQEYEAELKRIEAERASKKEAADAICASDVEKSRKSGQALADTAREEKRPVLEALTAEIAELELLAKQEQQAAGTRESIDRARKDAAANREQWALRNTAIENLRQLRLSLAERLPIKGVMVRDGRIVREQDGGLVPLSAWNSADQIKLCLRIGMMVANKAGFVCIDGAERFDAKNRKALVATAQKYAEEQGLQFLIATVSAEGGPLQVGGA